MQQQEQKIFDFIHSTQFKLATLDEIREYFEDNDENTDTLTDILSAMISKGLLFDENFNRYSIPTERLDRIEKSTANPKSKRPGKEQTTPKKPTVTSSGRESVPPKPFCPTPSRTPVATSSKMKNNESDDEYGSKPMTRQKGRRASGSTRAHSLPPRSGHAKQTKTTVTRSGRESVPPKSVYTTPTRTPATRKSIPPKSSNTKGASSRKRFEGDSESEEETLSRASKRQRKPQLQRTPKRKRISSLPPPKFLRKDLETIKQLHTELHGTNSEYDSLLTENARLRKQLDYALHSQAAAPSSPTSEALPPVPNIPDPVEEGDDLGDLLNLDSIFDGDDNGPSLDIGASEPPSTIPSTQPSSTIPAAQPSSTMPMEIAATSSGPSPVDTLAFCLKELADERDKHLARLESLMSDYKNSVEASIVSLRREHSEAIAELKLKLDESREVVAEKTAGLDLALEKHLELKESTEALKKKHAEAIDKNRSRAEKLEKEIVELRSKLHELRVQLQEKIAELDKAVESRKGLDISIEALKSEYATSLQDVMGRNEKLEEETMDLKSNIEVLQREIELKIAEHDRVLVGLISFQESIESLKIQQQKDLEEASSQNQLLAKDVADLKSQLDELKVQYDTKVGEYVGLASDFDAFNEQRKALEEELSNERNLKEELRDRLNSSQSLVEKLKMEANSADKELESVKEQISNLDQQFESAVQEKVQLAKEKDSLTNLVSQLEAKQSDFQLSQKEALSEQVSTLTRANDELIKSQDEMKSEMNEVEEKYSSKCEDHSKLLVEQEATQKKLAEVEEERQSDRLHFEDCLKRSQEECQMLANEISTQKSKVLGVVESGYTEMRKRLSEE